MKIFLFAFVLVGLLLAGGAAAQETNVEAAVEAETVTTADLGVEEPGLLPTSPLYFFKEIGRGLQRAFTFNAVAKTELELRIASEKAAEAAKVTEENPSDERGISRALLNYERGQERLRARLESLRDTSNNPNVDRLLDMVTQRQIVHEKLLDDLQAKHNAQRERIESARARVDATIGEVVRKDTAEKFAERLDRALTGAKGSTFKHVRAVEILDDWREQVSQEARERVGNVREKFVEEAERSIEDFTEQGERAAEELQEILRRIPGDALKRSVVLEEIRVRASDRAARALEETTDELDKALDTSANLAERASEQIERAEKSLAKATAVVEEKSEEAGQSANVLLENASLHLEEAKSALAEEYAGRAFGLARSAEAISRNVVRILEKGQEVAEGATEVISMPEELDRVQERIRPVFPRTDRESDRKACTLEYAPVCGTDGKTYSNRCFAENEGKVEVAYRGECGDRDSSGRVEPTPVPTPVPDPLPEPRPEPRPVPPPSSILESRAVTLEADDAGFYPSSEIRVPRGAKVKLTFHVRTSNVYFGGLDFRSSKFTTPQILPGNSTTVEFVADESFDFKSYWPASERLKATGRVIVE